jgi:AraC-like DNA-binding protein
MSVVAAPSVETHKLGLEDRSFDGPAVLEVAAGEILARGDADDPARGVAGDVVFVGSGRCCLLRARPRPAELVVFHVSNRWAEPLAALAGVELVRSPLAFSIERRGTDDARRASRLLRDLTLALQARRGAAGLRVVAATAELLDMLVHRRHVDVSSLPPPRAPTRRHGAFLEAARQLESEPLDGVNLAGFARAVGLSERQASRLFRETFGRSFREHLVALKVDRARRLLRETDHSVLAIAGEAGFSSLSHFNSVFRRRVGATPSAFRARARRG